MTPYQLRFEVFKQAYNMMNDQFNIEYDTAREWNEKVNRIDLEYPQFPTLDKVLERAQIINDFVSSTK